MAPSAAQIGRCGELLVQLRLLQRGIESAPMCTDTGVDLVAFASGRRGAKTIQVKTNLKPKPAGGKGRAALDWWIPRDCPAQLVATVDLSTETVWLYSFKELKQVAQQQSDKGYHLYILADPGAVGSKKHSHSVMDDFASYRLEVRLHELVVDVPDPEAAVDVISLAPVESQADLCHGPATWQRLRASVA